MDRMCLDLTLYVGECIFVRPCEVDVTVNDHSKVSSFTSRLLIMLKNNEFRSRGKELRKLSTVLARPNFWSYTYIGCCKLENEILKEAKNAQK